MACLHSCVALFSTPYCQVSLQGDCYKFGKHGHMDHDCSVHTAQLTNEAYHFESTTCDGNCHSMEIPAATIHALLTQLILVLALPLIMTSLAAKMISALCTFFSMVDDSASSTYDHSQPDDVSVASDSSSETTGSNTFSTQLISCFQDLGNM